MKGVDGKHPATHDNSHEEHLRNLGRAIESALSDERTSGGPGTAIRDNAEASRTLISQGIITELDPGHFFASVQAAGQKNLGRNEHAVYHDPASKRAFKITKENAFGVERDQAGTLISYLRRIQANNEILADDIRLEGAFKNPETGGYRLLTRTGIS